MKKIVLILLILLVGSGCFANYSVFVGGGYGLYTKSTADDYTAGGLALQLKGLYKISGDFSFGFQTGYTTFFSGTTGVYDQKMYAVPLLLIGQLNVFKESKMRIYALAGAGAFLLYNDMELSGLDSSQQFGFNIGAGVEFDLSPSISFVVDMQMQNVVRSMGTDSVMVFAGGIVFNF